MIEEILKNKDVYMLDSNGNYFLLYDKNQKESKNKIYIDEVGDIIIEEGN